MPLLKVATVVGARPQFIKAAVVSRELRRRKDIREILIHTGQHYDANMSDVFFDELEIAQPDHLLGIGGGGHGQQTGRMLEALERVLMSERPDVVVVYGDTNSTLAAALAAAKLHVPLAHVEAGLRSFNMKMPEEVNRIVTDRLSSLLFTPTVEADKHLIAEGTDPSRIHRVGDVMYDAVQLLGSADHSRIEIPKRPYLLATIHRAETTDHRPRLAATIDALTRLSRRLGVVLPLHPRTRAAIEAFGIQLGGIDVREPIGYRAMAALQASASVIVTDSGGVQKEAFFHGVPCVTVRDETEWVELVRGGWNRLVPPTDAQAIENAVEAALAQPYPSRSELYGDGKAASRIASLLGSVGA
jgi:UDP-GlcNAc3NAcA epimerase